jgi:hypothetical protein
MIRSIVSVIAGFVFFVLAVWALDAILGFEQGARPEGLVLVLIICFEAVVTFVSGYLTAMIAKRKEMLHALIIFGVFGLMGVVGFIVHALDPAKTMDWLGLVYIFIIAPCALLGGLVRKRQSDKGAK